MSPNYHAFSTQNHLQLISFGPGSALVAGDSRMNMTGILISRVEERKYVCVVCIVYT